MVQEAGPGDAVQVAGDIAIDASWFSGRPFMADLPLR